jgi:O-antigen ligase
LPASGVRGQSQKNKYFFLFIPALYSFFRRQASRVRNKKNIFIFPAPYFSVFFIYFSAFLFIFPAFPPQRRKIDKAVLFIFLLSYLSCAPTKPENII